MLFFIIRALLIEKGYITKNLINNMCINQNTVV